MDKLEKIVNNYRQFVGIVLIMKDTSNLPFFSYALAFYSWLICHLIWAFFSVEVYYLGWALLALFVSLPNRFKGDSWFQSFTFQGFFFVH